MSFGEWLAMRRTAADPGEDRAISPEDQAVLDKLANKVVEWKMTVPAIMFLESVKPLNYIGSQAMVFFEPFVQTLFNIRDYDRLRIMLERRETIELLLLKIEEIDAAVMDREREVRKQARAARRGQGFFARLLRRRPPDASGRPPEPPPAP